MLVALDTSTSQASIAAVRDGHLAAELTWDVGRRHSQELLVRLQWLLEMCDARPGDLTGVAVALGPGSFNGVRVALAAAKSLAFARELPLYGFSTLDVSAWGHADPGGALCAVLEAGRGELYAARYALRAADLVTESAGSPAAAPVWVAGALWRVSEYEVLTPAALAQTTPGQVLICGEWRAATRLALWEAFGARARFAAELGGRRASWLAALALERRLRGMADEPAKIEPLYLRRPAITVSGKRSPLDPGPGAPEVGHVAVAEEGDASALRH
jgi:tRNA threonylcarbamoyladenosine biosynthesis protein TsaB